MKELTYGELKQGLLCCTVYHDCTNCPLYINDDLGPQQDCTYKLMSAAMNCINVMEKDLANVNKRVEELVALTYIEEPISNTDYVIAMQNLRRYDIIDQNGKLNPMYKCILTKRRSHE